MRYVLRKRVLGRVPQIEINADSYARYKSARSILSNALALEEKYEILISNYLEFETTILGVTAADMVREDVTYASFFEVRLALNRRLVNLLTSARLYLDQLSQHVAACAPDGEAAAARIKKIISEQWDSYREYRFMDALRNYTQHRGIPIHAISHAASWIGSEDLKQLQYSLKLVSEASILKEDADFKHRVLQELDEKTDLTLFVRRYIECLSTVHAAVRDTVEESVNGARDVMHTAHTTYLAAGASDVVGLCACALEDERDVETEYTVLLLDWDDVRIALQKRNHQLVNLHRRYVTNQSTLGKKTT